MKGMQKIQRGSGFRGCADYLFDHDNGRVIGGNMVGTTPRALAAEFGVARRQRPDIERPVWHNSLRLPHDERVEMTEEKWREIGVDYMHGMGFSEQHQWVCVLHNDHVHFLANRVGLDGSVFLGRNENLKSPRPDSHQGAEAHHERAHSNSGSAENAGWGAAPIRAACGRPATGATAAARKRGGAGEAQR